MVTPQDVRWEPSHGLLDDAVSGRFVLFLGSDTRGGPRDVWRARVRLTPEGRPLLVLDPHNVTATPLGDDHALVIRGARAAFATVAFGQEQSVTLLDTDGEGTANSATTLAERTTSYLTNLQQTGSGAGIGRVEVTLDQPAMGVGLALTDDALAIDLADAPLGQAIRHGRLDFARAELAAGALGMHSESSRHLPKNVVFWAVDTVRAVPWIGPAPIAWAEERAFAVRDTMRQASFKLGGASSSDTDTLATPPLRVSAQRGTAASASPQPPASILDTSQTGADTGHWPPAAMGTIWKTAEPGEGVWVTPQPAWTRNKPPPRAEDAGDPPPAFARTFVRPDESRAYAKVILVAMDMRQLDLGMEAGVEDPKPMTGPHGAGRLPRDPLISQRVVAAFNGAFKTEHGNYGMMVNKRVLLPPQPSAATVIVLKDTRVGIGTWGTTQAVSGVKSVADADIVSFRQNLDALIENGEINPTKRALWGYTLPGSGMQTERTGLCVTGAGHLVYAWGEDVSATTLAKAMKMADCAYGMHLDMNPHHTGFIFTSIQDLKSHAYRSELLSPQMEISPDRYIEYAPKDFFYVMQHDPTPPAFPGATWRPDPGAQPAPTWMPGLWRTELASGIEVYDVEPGRASFRIRAGSKEPDAMTGAMPSRELSDEDAHRVLFSAGLGVALEKHPRGLATDGRMVLQFGAGEGGTDNGLLVARADGTLSIARQHDFAIEPHEDAAEMPLILDGAAAMPNLPEGAVTTRAALGLTDRGRVLIARGDATSYAPLANALREAGCTRAVALDRGSRHAPSLHRAGTSSPPRAHYDETTLYAMAVPMKPRGFRFEAQAAVAQAPK